MGAETLKPQRYFVEYDDPVRFKAEVARHGGDAAFADPAHFRRDKGADSLEAARVFARGCVGPVIYERVKIRDETPPGDPPGLLWEWDTVLVEESDSGYER